MSAITLTGVSKKFQLYRRPLDRLKELVLKRPCHEEVWALRDVSLAVRPGTTTGLVGVNGSGKSTILQLVAGTLTPTSGEVKVAGRIAALLELGAGFNPEFTGRENVMMNGALMGLDEDQILRRFASIAGFAEIGDFIERPVKTYSSGMYVRLAFATAIHMDPEILLVDEALAVGDIAFQHRCLRKIKELQAEGTTILFVSHDLGAVQNLCDEAVLVAGGRVLDVGAPRGIVQRYTALVMGSDGEPAPEASSEAASETSAAPAREAPSVTGAFRHGDGQARVSELRLMPLEGESEREIFQSGETARLALTIQASGAIAEPVVGFMLRNRLGVDVYGTNTEKLHRDLAPLAAGESVEVCFEIPLRLLEGAYSVTIAVHSSDLTSHDWIDEARYFEVIGAPEAIGIANLEARVHARPLSEVPSS